MTDKNPGVYFENCLILENRAGQSKAGNPYGVVRFLDQFSLDVYEVFVFGDSLGVAGKLLRGNQYRLFFRLQPDSRGGAGVQLVLMDCELVQA